MHDELAKLGHADVDESGSNIGADVIRAAFNKLRGVSPGSNQLHDEEIGRDELAQDDEHWITTHPNDAHSGAVGHRAGRERCDPLRPGCDRLQRRRHADRSSVKGFINAMPESERQSLSPNGRPTKQAIDRMLAATFYAAYGDTELVGLMAQATDPESRNLIDGNEQGRRQRGEAHGWGLRNFVQTVDMRENPSGGAAIPSVTYCIARDGFTWLAMRFCGTKALAFQVA